MSTEKINLTKDQINELWEQGYRPWEIYVANDKIVNYCGSAREPGEVSGWEIKFVFAKKDDLKNYPFFDCIIAMSSVSDCNEYFVGEPVAIKTQFI